jgi:hypothetical protein
MATTLATIQALLPSGDRQASRGDLHKVFTYVTKALTPAKAKQKQKTTPTKNNNTASFLEAQVWQTATAAMTHASLLESSLVRKFGNAALAGATAALDHHADKERSMDMTLVHAISTSLGRVIRSLRFVPKLADAHALIEAASRLSDGLDEALVAVCLNCLLVGCSNTQPRKVFDALVCENTMQALVQWQQQSGDEAQAEGGDIDDQAGLAIELVRSLSKQVLATCLFDRDILGSYSDACTRATALLSVGSDEASTEAPAAQEAETPTKPNKRARGDKKQNKQSKSAKKQHQHFLSQLFTVLGALSARTDTPVSLAALESFAALVSECHRCLVANAASAEVNPVSGTGVGIGKRKRDASAHSVDTLLWFELLQVAQPFISNPPATSPAETTVATVRAVSSLLGTGHQLGIYSASKHRLALSTWFAGVFEAWESSDLVDTASHAVLNARLSLIQQLIDIDHNVVEPFLQRIFVFAFGHRASTSESDAKVATIGAPASEFTLHIVSHYAKLRKLSLAMQCIMSAAASGSTVAANMCSELFPNGQSAHVDQVDQEQTFDQGLRDSLRQLPSGQIAETWDCFQSALVDSATALQDRTEPDGNQWLMCMVTSLVVRFVNGVQVTQFNSALLKQRCQSVIDVVARPVLKAHVVDANKHDTRTLAILTSTSDMIVALTNLARLCEAWTFDAMPTDVQAALARTGDGVGQQHRDNPLHPVDHPYQDDLLSPAFQVSPKNSDAASLPVDAFFKVVSDLVDGMADSAVTAAAAEVARESTTLLALTCMRSLHMVHFRPFTLLGNKAPHATAGVNQTRKLIVFVLAQARAATVDGDLVLNRMFSGVNLEVVGQLAGPGQVDSLLGALVEHTCVALVSRNRAPGEPWTNSAFYEVRTVCVCWMD